MHIMHGVTPPEVTRFGAAITIMREMRWSWPDYLSAPAALVDEIAVRIEAREYWQEKKRQLDKAKHGGNKFNRSSASQRT